MNDDEYSRRYQAQLRKESEEADQDWVRKQKLLDHLWQAKLDAEASLDDDYVEVAGFRVPRYRTSCHVGRHDPDFGQH